MERSDGITRLNKNDHVAKYIYVDEDGNEIVYNKEMNYFVGYNDGDIKENNACKVPQAFKLLKQEVQAMSVNMKLITKEKKDEDVYED
jgi:DNA-directed RNA polymerase beta subunit